MARQTNIDERIKKLQAELDFAMQQKSEAEKKMLDTENKAIIKVIRKHIADRFEGFNASEFIEDIGVITGCRVPVPVDNEVIVKPSVSSSINTGDSSLIDEF